MSWREDRIGSALRGENPTVLARLPRPAQREFLASMALLGEAVERPAARSIRRCAG